MSLLARVKIRLQEEETEISDLYLDELIETARDRICLLIGEEELPALFNSICVDVVIKMYRRKHYEGISSEGVDTLSTSFVKNVLAEYAEEFNSYLDSKEKSKEVITKKVRFI